MGAYFLKKQARSPILEGFGRNIYALLSFSGQQYFRKKLYGLYSKGDKVNNPTSFTFAPYELTLRYWANNWDSKWYMAPIPQKEINKGYGMTQNPGW